MYGGRAIDSFDRRILKVYLDEYMGDFLFYTFRRFHFFRNDDVDFKIPPDGPKDVYVGECGSDTFRYKEIKAIILLGYCVIVFSKPFPEVLLMTVCDLTLHIVINDYYK